MSERSKRISKLKESATSRASYIRAKLNVLIPSQIRALRLKSDNMTQKQLAVLADMAQPRISAMERPGEAKFNIDTLVRLASAFKVALKVEFVPFGEMLAWENSFSQDAFNVTRIDNDLCFLNPMLPAVQQAAHIAFVAAAKYEDRGLWKSERGQTMNISPRGISFVVESADVLVGTTMIFSPFTSQADPALAARSIN